MARSKPSIEPDEGQEAEAQRIYERLGGANAVRTAMTSCLPIECGLTAEPEK